MRREALADYLEDQAGELAQDVTARMEKQRPELFRRYRDELRNEEKTPEEWCAEDTAHHVRALAAAVAINDPSEFDRYRSWLVGLLGARNVPEEDMTFNFEVLAALLEERLGEKAKRAVSMLRPRSST